MVWSGVVVAVCGGGGWSGVVHPGWPASSPGREDILSTGASTVTRHLTVSACTYHLPPSAFRFAFAGNDSGAVGRVCVFEV